MAQADGPDNVRALLCAMSARGSDLIVPVSTLAIQNELSRRESKVRATELLSQLSDLREVQRLSGGFWLPAPLRLITAEGLTLACSGLPTARLARQYGIKLQPIGVLRAIYDTPEPLLAPTYSLAEWLGSPNDSIKWSAGIISGAHWRPPYQLDELKIFRAWQSRARHRWLEQDEMLVNRTGVALAKIALRDGRAQYYLADVHRGMVERVHELPTDSDIARLMCALRFRDGDPVTVTASRANRPDELVITFEILPIPEAVFVRAIACSEVSESGFLRKAHIPTLMAAQTKALMDALGASTQGTWQ
jgi:hypothetical protein